MLFASFGEYLKVKREKSGLTQTDVSLTLGYSSAQFVSNWERGIAKPPTKSLLKLSKLYKLDKEELLDAYIETTRNILETQLGMKSKSKRARS